MLAYLVIRDGPKWTDVFRLVPGESVRIGRAPTNQIVIKDDRASRDHAEIFHSQGEWTLRDLDSRNGSAVGNDLVEGDYELKPGDIIRIGRSQLMFVHDLSNAFSGDSSGVTKVQVAENYQDTNDQTVSDANVLDETEQDPTTITHRRGQNKFLQPSDEEDESGIPKVGRAATRLCRLAFELAKVPDLESMAQMALSGLFEGASIDAGAVLLFPQDHDGKPSGTELQIVAARSDTEHRYHKISQFLASTVLREGEAVLARNIMGDSTLGSRDSKGEIHATSVMCAPIRRGGEIFGLVHLYSTNPDLVPDPDDLEFALAVADTVAVALENLSQRQQLSENLDLVKVENEQLRNRLGVQSEIVGKSKVIDKITEQIGRAAPSKATVLIRGESGVGKELVAQAIHYSSPRKGKAFVCLNCAALTESLLESELFGHERGAFTGATERKFGKFESADGGTLMLDEIGEMSPQIQAKFLRVLEGHPFERVGGSEPVQVDVRVIAATNRDLEKEVEQNNFRRDLYFRLRVVEMFVPGLRKRPEDIPVLAQYFLEKITTETGRRVRGFTPRALEQMFRYRWPGNVRELKNVVERAVVLCEGHEIDAHDLVLSNLQTAGETSEVSTPSDEFTPLPLSEVERRHILATLNATGWNKSQTASILGIERSTLDRKIRRYELKREKPAAQRQ